MSALRASMHILPSQSARLVGAAGSRRSAARPVHGCSRLRTLVQASGDKQAAVESTPATSSSSRRELLRLAGATLAGVSFAQPALAYATLSESLSDLEEDLRLAQRDLDADPDNEILLGQREYFADRIQKLKDNAAFCEQTQAEIAAGGKFMQHAVLRVPDLEESVRFWNDGVGALVTR